MKTRYVIKGIGKEQTIASVINIFVNDQGKIEKVQDKWNGSLPDSGIKNVSVLNPLSWMEYGGAWLFWGWSWVWYTWPWMVRRCALRLQAAALWMLDNSDGTSGFRVLF